MPDTSFFKRWSKGKESRTRAVPELIILTKSDEQSHAHTFTLKRVGVIFFFVNVDCLECFRGPVAR